jgi:hypothetical protein
MNCGEAVVISKMEDDDMQDEWRMRSLDLVFGSEINGDAILPLLKLPIQFANGIQ